MADDGRQSSPGRPKEGAHPGGRRRRRRRGPGKGPRERNEPAQKIIAKAQPAVNTTKPADEPLTPSEAAKMRLHFRFLKEHRKLLNLKVNAAEDLLLNGVREPEHRGVCQHLLDKVERSRVELVVQQLDPQARTRLLEGVIAFSPDVAYLLLYLESLRAASRPDAAGALAEALRHIDFASVSAAQMRRVLDLIVELLSERDRPQLLFSLLQSATFQEAFDKSAERLPQELADIVVPLRAAHAVVVRGGKNPHDGAALARGVEMLLRGHERVLRGQSLRVRQRLFDSGVELAGQPARQFAPGLAILLDSFPKDDRIHSESGLALAGWMLSRELEDEARKLLATLKREHPSFRLPGRWLEALDGRRIGGIGLESKPPKDGSRRERDAFESGLLIRRQLPVWVRIGTASEAERLDRAVELARSLAVPGVAPVLDAGRGGAGEPYLAIPRLGRPANEVLLPKGSLGQTEARALAAEGVRILAALAAAGVRLPDARFRRFAVDASGRLWLRDLMDAERVAPEEARSAHALLASEFAADVVERSGHVASADVLVERLRTTKDCVALVGLLD